jgi:hypothetical protein
MRFFKPTLANKAVLGILQNSKDHLRGVSGSLTTAGSFALEFSVVRGFEPVAGRLPVSKKEGLREAVSAYDFPPSVRPVIRSS